MRPTFSEQIDETRRILDDVVLPALGEGHAAEVLRGLIGNLRMMRAAWPKLAPFLDWDNRETAGLVAAFGDEIAPGWQARIADARALATDNDIAALTESNQELRGLLSLCIERTEEEDNRMAAIRSHLAARSARYPMRSTLPTPKSPALDAS